MIDKIIQAYLNSPEDSRDYSVGLNILANVPDLVLDMSRHNRLAKRQNQVRLDAELQRQLERIQFFVNKGKLLLPSKAPKFLESLSPDTPSVTKAKQTAPENRTSLPKDSRKKTEEIEELDSEPGSKTEGLSDSQAKELQYLHNQKAKLSNSLQSANSDSERKSIVQEITVLEDRMKIVQAPKTSPKEEVKLPRSAELIKERNNLRSRKSKLKSKLKKSPEEAKLLKEMQILEAKLAEVELELDNIVEED